MTDLTVRLEDRLAGRTIFVTGGGSGIGRGACERMAAEGANIVVADIRTDIADETAAGIREAGGTAMAVECNVADEDQVAAAIGATVDEFGGLYGLFNNAGTVAQGWIHETTLHDWEFVMGVNITGAFLCSKHALPHMMDDGGSIVMTASIAASVIGAGGSAASYAVSKAGMVQLARQIAVDYGSYGIRANTIQPAGVQGSNLGKHVVEDAEQMTSPPAGRMKRPKPWLPIFRQGHPVDEYGATVAFLMSDDAGYITGAQIPVDGGYLST